MSGGAGWGPRRGNRETGGVCQNWGVEITWYGGTCVRLRGRDATVVADAYSAIVGPTGRGITGDIATYSHPDDAPPARGKAAQGRRSRDGKTVVPSSLDPAFVLDGPGEYEVRGVLLTGVRTYRDDDRGAKRGKGTAFVVELDGLHTIHLGDIGHLLTEEKLGDIGTVDIACVPVGGALSATRTAELIAQLDPKIVVAMPVCEREADCAEALGKFFHEMGGEPAPQPKLSVSISTLPPEVSTVLLESRGKV
jgi:L-ascorbate metabolism protein UlaG (beta-lactamase superfamily)